MTNVCVYYNRSYEQQSKVWMRERYRAEDAGENNMCGDS
jgi:hypothetical protein